MAVIITLNAASTEIITIGAKGEKTAKTIAVAVTPNPESNTLYEYNLPDANSLHPAEEGLKLLFPGLKLQAKRQVETQHPEELVRHCCPHLEQDNQLSINSPGEEQNIFNALAEAGLLKFFTQLTVLAHEKPVYQNAKPAQEIVDLFTKHGFEYGGTNTKDPDWPTLTFKRNRLQNTVDKLRGELQSALEKFHAEVEKNKALEKYLAETQSRLQQLEKARKSTEDRLNDTLHDERKAGQRLSAELESLKVKLAETEEQLEERSNTQSTLKTLQDRMEYLFGQNTLQLEQAANALGQHVSQTAEITSRELEAGIALQRVAPGAAAITHSGLPKSAALELASQLNTKNYDLIIELGSGSTTYFIAQLLKNAGKDHSSTTENQRSLSHYVEPSEDDLPRRILSVDHNRNRQKELGENLTNAGLASYVSLQFAPLVPSQYAGKEQLFYDCSTRLQQVAHLLDSRLGRILVVVNIDPTETGPEPGAALPAVLQYLSAHQLDIVIHSPSQQQITDQWLSILSQRGLDHSALKAFGTGQVQHLTVNP
ncbi:hypothetical protein [Marinobacterium mangrovicola]|uniref:Uncharacterized protein n=1 Tax=Marinobacterium mangrovicola TaxID=1476959 RepID=A0A4V2PE17_9GAMM|nr:hypothetical protein [Marinobacterium mangrovicola]TCK07246.1 hypothetical protein CLV83_2105 [Marinobacterium mangrovicola]